MDFERHQNDTRTLRQDKVRLGAMVACLVCSQLLSLVVIVRILGTERTVIVPPSIDKTFWVSNDSASREYLEQMAGFLTWLVLDVSPATIDWKRNVLLNYVAPDEYAAMKTKMDLEAERLRANNATTSFLIQQLTPNEQQQSVVITGRLRRQVNGQDTGEPETRAYLAQFQYAGGRVHVKTFKEVPYGSNTQVSVGAAGSDPVVR